MACYSSDVGLETGFKASTAFNFCVKFSVTTLQSRAGLGAGEGATLFKSSLQQSSKMHTHLL